MNSEEGPEPRWRRRIRGFANTVHDWLNLAARFPRTAHWCYRYSWAPFAAILTYTLTPLGDATGAARYFIGLPVALFTVTAILTGINHQGSALCEACADRDWVADPDAQLARYDARLRAYHRHFAQVANGVVVASVTAVTLSLMHAPYMLSASIAGAPLAAIMATEWFWRRPHWRLAPWCPYCDDDEGGGGGGWMNQPDPDPHARRPV